MYLHGKEKYSLIRSDPRLPFKRDFNLPSDIKKPSSSPRSSRASSSPAPVEKSETGPMDSKDAKEGENKEKSAVKVETAAESAHTVPSTAATEATSVVKDTDKPFGEWPGDTVVHKRYKAVVACLTRAYKVKFYPLSPV